TARMIWSMAARVRCRVRSSRSAKRRSSRSPLPEPRPPAPMPLAKLKTSTLGCKVNQYETEYLREGLLSAGFRDADKHEPADLCIVNTCTVTAEGDSKSRQTIRRMARNNPDARIVVMGCYATRAPEEVA